MPGTVELPLLPEEATTLGPRLAVMATPAELIFMNASGPLMSCAPHDAAAKRFRSFSRKMSQKSGCVWGVVSLLFGGSAGVQADDGIEFPMADRPGPALGMAGFGRFIDLAALVE